jgi:N-acyl-D-aspartate/D-glutamate deacylase
MALELAIRGGTLIDGTGTPGRRADVGIENGRIAAIAEDLTAERTLDASGCAVAPGFIDIHTHYDAQVFWDPALTPSCFHGVTTVVAGNCGFSIAPTRPEHRALIAHTLEKVEDMDRASLMAGIPWEFTTFPQYLDTVSRRGTRINFAAYIGHTALRLFVMGDAAYERAATAEERAQLERVLREALLAGAAGFATSFAPTHNGVDGKPVPSRRADRAEVEALLGVLGEVRRGVFSIAPGEVCPLPDLYDLQPKVGVPFTYGALLTHPSGWHRQLLELNHKGWERGAEVWPQVTPRPLTFAMTLADPFTLNSNPVFGALVDRPEAERRAAYADPGFRQRALDFWATAHPALAPRWESFEIAESGAHPARIGARIVALAAERGVRPIDALLDLARAEASLGSLRVRAVLMNDDEAEVAKLLVEKTCTLGLSDAGAHVGQLCDAPQATDLLGNWVRKRGVLPLEEAIRKLTSAQADLLGLPDRGRIATGACADVVVFDPSTVAPGPTRRVRDFPANAERLTADQPTGIRHVLVNGLPIQCEGQSVAPAARPGQVVRPERR